jgi:hypothetical protein
MVFKGSPKNLQDVTLWRLNASVDFEAFKAFRFGDDGVQPFLNGFVKSGLLPGLNANVGEFQNHDAL